MTDGDVISMGSVSSSGAAAATEDSIKLIAISVVKRRVLLLIKIPPPFCVLSIPNEGNICGGKIRVCIFMHTLNKHIYLVFR